jgi:hypothetical protein
MKTIRILQTVFLIAIVATLFSCTPSREYAYRRYPEPRTSLSLIISPRPGLIISQDPYGRYYYRSPEGYMYWRGYDNRFYLDRQYYNRGYNNHFQYNEWNRYWNNNSRRRHR